MKASSEKEEIKRIYVGVYTVFKVVTQRTIQSFLKDCNLISTRKLLGTGKEDSILLLNIDMYVFKPNIVKITSPLSLFAIERMSIVQNYVTARSILIPSSNTKKHG